MQKVQQKIREIGPCILHYFVAIRSIYERALSKGLLNLLYNLLTLRPCFGCFSPELVETVAKGGSNQSDVYVDRRFVGSSANGRNYAGTVRSKRCRVIAKSKIADTCSECEALKDVSINRSVLSSEKQQSTRAAQGHQKSVWQGRRVY